MRHHRTLDLDPGRRVTVHEVRLRDVIQLSALLTPDALARPGVELVRERLPDLLTLLGDSLTLPAGETLEDLSLSECEAIGTLWWEMHQGFFDRLRALHAPPRPRQPSSNAAP